MNLQPQINDSQPLSQNTHWCILVLHGKSKKNITQLTSTPVSFTTCHLLVKFHGFQVSNNLINFTICSLQCTCTHSFYFRVIQYHQFPKDTFTKQFVLQLQFYSNRTMPSIHYFKNPVSTCRGHSTDHQQVQSQTSQDTVFLAPLPRDSRTKTFSHR